MSRLPAAWTVENLHGARQVLIGRFPRWMRLSFWFCDRLHRNLHAPACYQLDSGSHGMYIRVGGDFCYHMFLSFWDVVREGLESVSAEFTKCIAA